MLRPKSLTGRSQVDGKGVASGQPSSSAVLSDGSHMLAAYADVVACIGTKRMLACMLEGVRMRCTPGSGKARCKCRHVLKNIQYLSPGVYTYTACKHPTRLLQDTAP